MNVLGDEVENLKIQNILKIFRLHRGKQNLEQHKKYKYIYSDQIQVKEIESFVIVYKYKDRFTSPFARTLRVITKMFGEILKQ